MEELGNTNLYGPIVFPLTITAVALKPISGFPSRLNKVSSNMSDCDGRMVV